MIQIKRRVARFRGLFLASIGISAVIGVPVAHAQLIYPHSPSEEKAANEVKEGLEAAKKAHLEAIDKHKAYLESAIAAERSAVTERQLAMRDAAILPIMDVQLRSPAKGTEALRGAIIERISAITGIAPVKGVVPGFEYMDLNARMAGDARAHLRDERARLKRQIRAFEAAGGEGEYCNGDGIGDGAGATKPGRSPGLFNGIKNTCGRIRGEIETLQEIYREAPPGMAAVLGDPRATAGAGSDLSSALQYQATTRRLLEAQNALTKAAAKRLKELKAVHQCELERATAGGNAEAVQRAADSVDDFITWLADWKPSAPVAALEAPPEAAASGNSECAVAAWPEGGLLAAAGLDQAQLDKALKAAQHLDPLRSVVASAQETAEKFRAEELGEIVQALADPQASDEQRAEAAVAASLLRLYGHAERLSASRSGKLPDTSGILVRLAAAQMRAQVAALEAGRLQKLADLAELRVSALMQEAVLLRQAQKQLQGAAPSFERALLAYSDSWSDGRLPAAVLTRDMVNLSYSTWVDRERAIAEAAYAALEPAALELQTYGAGGIKASDVAGYLHTLGLGAIAWAH